MSAAATSVGAVSSRVLVVQLCDDDGPGRLGDWLTASGLDLDVVRPDLGAELPALSDYDGLVVLGGPQAAYDPPATSPYLEPVMSLLRRAVADQVPTLGVCLGGQLLARALGGVVRNGGRGPEIGAHLVAKRDVAAEDPVFRAVPFTPDVIQWHYDEIAELPPSAVLLASSPAYPNQAFRVGERAWGLQFHIETTPEMVAHWAEQDREQATALGLDVDAALAGAVAVHEDVEQAWAPAMDRYAGVVHDAAARRTAAT